jgi:hypothetical protein
VYTIECITFIENKSNDARVFLEKDVSKALRKLGYTMKVTSSTVAYQVFTERTLLDLALAAWDSWDTKEAFH